ncbi:hypothetical protein BDM02DRAFT_3114405 [Thelephora ganbajun]|uniref:Uncharacterized protein n=1 Tax=Thelephora ganbajun TaxID=370292 RepID=A0ACB6ZHD0_THEGA|nr:hypothetical protein BDM02DRAFT_3114405 [Thelephora ganbajun]
MQLSTRNYRAPPDPVTKSKLVQEVAKRIQWHIADLEANSDVDERWRVGQGRMKVERMVIAGLINVSAGSWSPIICVE